MRVKKVKRLVQQFKPENYRLFLAPDVKTMTFTGSVEIIGYKTGRPSNRITLHQNGLKIQSASLTHIDKKDTVHDILLKRINLHTKFDELRLHSNTILYPGKYEITIEFSGKITEQMHGMYPCYYEGKQKCLIATQFESHHAREVFPCIDEPEAKATFDLTLLTPKDQTVLSNTPIKAQNLELNAESSKKIKPATSDYQLKTEFERTPIMSAYLLAFVFGDLIYTESKTKNNVPVRTYATASHKHLLDFPNSLGVKCIDFFEEYFNTPYPLTKLDMVALPEFSSGAMENWGLITYRESMLLVDPKISSIESQQICAYVVAHECSHMWFGNLVTMKWWDDLWLNESFANMMEYAAIDAIFPQWKVWEQFTNSETSMAMARDSLPNVQSVRTPVNHPDEIGSLFDPAIVYAKGGNILNMLRHVLGEDKFRLGLTNYFKKYSYANTIADDLWTEFEKVSSFPASDFMHNWLNQPGFPVVNISFEPGEDNFTVNQNRLTFLSDKNSTKTLWQIPIFVAGAAHPIMFNRRTDSFKLKIVPNEPIFNDQSRGYYVAKYANQAHFELIKNAVASNQLDTINRLQLIMGYLLMEKSGLVGSTDTLDLINAYSSESDDAVWGTVASALGNIRRLVKQDVTAEKNFDSYCAHLIKDQLQKVGWVRKSDEPAKDQRLRSLILSLAASAKVPAVHKSAIKRFSKMTKPDDVAADIRGVVYYVAARFGTDADFKKLLKLYKEVDNADEKNEIASALCATRSIKNINILLKMMSDGEVRLQDVISWYIGLLRNTEARTLAWQWQVDNWDWIVRYYGSDKSYDYFPRASASIFSTKNEYQLYKNFFSPMLSSPALGRTIKLGLEELSNNVAWRTKNERAVKAWLKRTGS